MEPPFLPNLRQTNRPQLAPQALNHFQPGATPQDFVSKTVKQALKARFIQCLNHNLATTDR